MRKVAILLPNLAIGGAERVAVNLANELAKRGYAVEMVLMSTTGSLIANLQSGIEIVDLKAERLRMVFFPLVRYLRRAKPDALLACMWPLTVIAVWARWMAQAGACRVLVAEHTNWSRSPIVNSRLRRWLVRVTMRCTFPWADRIVAVSQGAANDLTSFAGLTHQAVRVIYNPVVGAAATPTVTMHAPADWWSGSHFRLLAVGMLKAEKDYATLLVAFARLRKQVDARLLILGEGELRPALETQTRLLCLEGSVFMPGFVTDPLPYYQQADLFVLSSVVEGLPTVLIEALAAGTPVVSTDCPFGPSEILDNGRFGRLIRSGDAAALASAMAESLVSSHDREALKGRAKDFSIEKAADQYERLLSGD